MENHPIQDRRIRIPWLAAALAAAAGILIVTWSIASKRQESATAGIRLFDTLGARLQKILGREVNIESNGAVSFPREIAEILLENHAVQVSTRYESSGWMGLGRSHVIMTGDYRARVGFDLSQASAEVDGGTLRVWLPRPRILSFETLEVGRRGEDISWWNPLEPAEMESAYRANRAEAERQIDGPGLLEGASDRLLRRVREGLEGLGLRVRVGLLPSPPT